jgi:hypothetical protein
LPDVSQLPAKIDSDGVAVYPYFPVLSRDFGLGDGWTDLSQQVNARISAAP